MRCSSAFIELPTPPFAAPVPVKVAAAVVNIGPATQTQNHPKPVPNHIVSKEVEVSPSLTTQTPIQPLVAEVPPALPVQVATTTPVTSAARTTRAIQAIPGFSVFSIRENFSTSRPVAAAPAPAASAAPRALAPAPPQADLISPAPLFARAASVSAVSTVSLATPAAAPAAPVTSSSSAPPTVQNAPISPIPSALSAAPLLPHVPVNPISPAPQVAPTALKTSASPASSLASNHLASLPSSNPPTAPVHPIAPAPAPTARASPLLSNLPTSLLSSAPPTALARSIAPSPLTVRASPLASDSPAPLLSSAPPAAPVRPIAPARSAVQASPFASNPPAPLPSPAPTVALGRPIAPAYPAAQGFPIATAPAILPTPPVTQGAAVTLAPPSTAPTGSPRPIAPIRIVATTAPKQQKATSASNPRRRVSNGPKGGKKRKRLDDDDDDIIRAGDSSSDDSDGVNPTITQTKSGRQIHRPSLYVPPPSSLGVSKANSTELDTPRSGDTKSAPPKKKRAIRKNKPTNIICIHCERGHSPSTNMIVFCDGCNRAWHQLCHDPHIANEVIWLKEKEWFCKECKPAPQPNPLPAVVNTVPQQLVKLRIPSNGSLQATPRVDVDATNFTMAERRGYLSSLSHASLVELLVNISEEHPSLTIFPSNLKELQLSKFVFQQSITKPTAITTLAASTPTNTSVSASSTNNVPSNNTGSNQPSSEQLPEIFSASQPKRKRQRYDSDEDSEYEEYQDHRLYPRAGNGFRLSLNVGDLDMLAEDPVCPTFSHSLHGPAQARAVARQVAPVWTAG